MQIRPRRLRMNENMRGLTREMRISTASLIYPLFIKEGTGIKSPISSLEGQFHFSPDRVCEAVDHSLNSGVKSFLLFGLPDHKDESGSEAWASEGVVQHALRILRARYSGEITLITDVCLCEYTNHGHCGVLKGETVDNDKTLPLLAKTAVSHAQAGADIVAPSDMMDGRVTVIRDALDKHDCTDTAILSYAVKYASKFYGPFRDAAGSAPSFGDRRTYQMDFHNRREALKEAMLDTLEGADMLMVKPAMAYGDII
ncbi:MAG: porphobilinogen synthase, partial [Oscillospiraceae bacterium]|nr:porphobilinogen synthase [Oscillospiraceae bacterium]